MLAPRRLGLVTTLHGTDVTIVGQDRSYLPITRFGIEKSDVVTAVSEHLKKVTIDVFQPKKEIEVVPNFIDPGALDAGVAAARVPVRARGPEGAHARLELPAREARPGRRRDLRPRLRQRVPATLVMIGDGPDRPAAEALCREKGIAPYVSFLGNMPALEAADARRGPLPPAVQLGVLRALGARGAGLRRPRPRLCRGRAAGGRRRTARRASSATSATSRASRTTAPTSSSTTRATRRCRRASRARAIRLFDADTIVSRYLALYERVLAAA